MKRTRWMLVGVLTTMLLWGATSGQAQQRAKQDQVLHRQVLGSIDGSMGTVLRAGAYAVVSVVGQPVAGRLVGGSLLHQHRKARAGQSVASQSAVPVSYALAANYPNPFNPETVIRFALPEAGSVRIAVYDLLGREVAVVVDREMAAGRHAVIFEGRRLASGMYVYRMEAGSFEQHRTMILVK